MHAPSLTVSISKVDEMEMLQRSSSARVTEWSMASRIWRSSTAGRFCMTVLRRVRRYSAMSRAVDEEMTKAVSGGGMGNEGALPRSWERLRVADGPEREQDGRTRHVRAWGGVFMRAHAVHGPVAGLRMCASNFLDRCPVMNQTHL